MVKGVINHCPLRHISFIKSKKYSTVSGSDVQLTYFIICVFSSDYPQNYCYI